MLLTSKGGGGQQDGGFVNCRKSIGFLLAGLVVAAITHGSVAEERGTPAAHFTPLPGRDFYRAVRSAEAYSLSLFGSHVKDIAFEVAAINAGVLAIGIKNWNWGSSSFHFKSEGWFGSDTGSGGVDKLGHAFSTALLADFYTDRIRQVARNPAHAALTAGILSMGTMTVVELFDGFSEDHGFSWEDMVANGTGVAFSLLRNTIPGMREIVDFRQEYFKRPHDRGFHPMLHYESKRFLLAFKLSGFDRFENTPLRYLELHAGYYARGFSREARLAGVRKRRKLFFGIGINLNRLLFGKYRRAENKWRWAGRFLLEHQQVPFTSIDTSTRDFYRQR